jgi:hypothetical protein
MFRKIWQTLRQPLTEAAQKILCKIACKDCKTDE